MSRPAPQPTPCALRLRRSSYEPPHASHSPAGGGPPRRLAQDRLQDDRRRDSCPSAGAVDDPHPRGLTACNCQGDPDGGPVPEDASDHRRVRADGACSRGSSGRRGMTRRSDKGVQILSGLQLGFGHQVAVAVQGHVRVRVSEPLRDLEDALPASDEQTGAGMPTLVRNPVHTETSGCWPPDATVPVSPVQEASTISGDEQTRASDRMQILAESLKDWNRSYSARLRSLDPTGPVAASDEDGGLADVTDAQGDDLTRTQSAVAEQTDDQPIAGAVHCGPDCLNLVKRYRPAMGRLLREWLDRRTENRGDRKRTRL